jgi:hypothetical protein
MAMPMRSGRLIATMACPPSSVQIGIRFMRLMKAEKLARRIHRPCCVRSHKTAQHTAPRVPARGPARLRTRHRNGSAGGEAPGEADAYEENDESDEAVDRGRERLP